MVGLLETHVGVIVGVNMTLKNIKFKSTKIPKINMCGSSLKYIDIGNDKVLYNEDGKLKYGYLICGRTLVRCGNYCG